MESKDLTPEEIKVYTAEELGLLFKVLQCDCPTMVKMIKEYAKQESKKAAEKAWEAAENYNFNYPTSKQFLLDKEQYLKQNFE